MLSHPGYSVIDLPLESIPRGQGLVQRHSLTNRMFHSVVTAKLELESDC
jgi:hypothetical protein